MIKIKIGGWAGQGTVLAGTILGKALALERGYNVVQRRSYSAAVRSGIAYSDVIADDSEVDELRIDKPDYLLVLYQNTLNAWKDMARDVEYLIVDSSRVEEIPDTDAEVYEVTAGKIAEEIASSKAANIVLLGTLAKISEYIDLDSLIKTIKSDFPEKYVDMNVRAVKKGFDFVDK